MSNPALNTIPSDPRLTYEDYLELPDDGKRYEIIEGELHATPAPVPRHQQISRRIQYDLMTALEKKGLGQVFNAPIDVLFDNRNIVQPDLVYIPAEDSSIIGDKNIEGVPYLAVEILSQHSRRRDVLVKSRLNARFGVPFYWIVDPDIDRIEVFQLKDDSYEPVAVASSPQEFEPPGMDGVLLDLREIFEQANSESPRIEQSG